MRLSLLELEPRETPAVNYDSGIVPIPGHGTAQPFPDFFGGVTTLTVGDVMTVGALAPGGPRVATFSVATGQRTQPDYFAGDPAARSGVVLVMPPGVTVPTDDFYTRLNDYAVYINYEPNISGDFQHQVDRLVYEALGKYGVRVTNMRPADYPGNYISVMYGFDDEFLATSPTAHGVFSPDGGAPANVVDETHPPEPWADNIVYVTNADVNGNAQRAAWYVTHEVGHAVGVDGDGPVPTLSQTDALAAGFAKARAMRGGTVTLAPSVGVP